MRKWYYRLGVRDIISPFSSRGKEESAKLEAKKLVERIEQLIDIATEEGLKDDLEEIQRQFEYEVETVQEFDQVLEDLYDTADFWGVWVDHNSDKVETIRE